MKKPQHVLPKSPDQIRAAEDQILELSKKIDFFVTEYSVEFLAAKMQKHEFVVPEYQREYTWEDSRKSRFIESLVLGLPIPFLFFWVIPEDGKLEIVDGSQRLRTIEEFLLGDFRLGELESLTALSGFTFAELPESRQRKINNRSIRGIVLNEHADAQARFDLFDRINTGSKIANRAEVRRGALAGPFMDLIIRLAKLPKFTRLAPVSKKDQDEREHEELMARFFAYSDGLGGDWLSKTGQDLGGYSHGMRGYNDRPSEFVFNYVREMNGLFREAPGLGPAYEERLEETLAFVERTFEYGFARSATGKATPRARFEAIAVGTRLAIDEQPELASCPEPEVGSWLNGREFSEVTGSDGANAIKRLRRRVEFVRDRLLRAHREDIAV